MDQPISLLLIPDHVRDRLLEAGYSTVRDVLESSVLSISTETGISDKEALSVMKLCRGGKEKVSKGATALDILHQERNQTPIVTFCKALDGMLHGGVPIGKITEFCGVPGIGKTQLGCVAVVNMPILRQKRHSIQLAIDVQIPEILAGVDGEAVYIDTEGSFVIQRVVAMANAVVTHLERVTRKQQDARFHAAREVTMEKLLKGIHYFRVLDCNQQLAVVETLSLFLSQHPKVRLIVMDSVAFHFRQLDDMMQRSRLLTGMAQRLIQLAEKHQVAVVLMNQMTTRITEGQARLAPALGDTWGHAVTNRVVLYWHEDKERRAYLHKSPSCECQTIVFRITAAGTRDVARTKRKEVS